MHFKKICSLVLCFLFIFTQLAYAGVDELSDLLTISEENQYLVYGEYAEVEINSSKKIDLNFSNAVVPFGMELEKVDSQTFVLYGRSEFLGKLCFLLDAQKQRGQTSVERLCLYSENNDELDYPRPVHDRFLDTVNVGARINLKFEIKNTEREIIQSLVENPYENLKVKVDNKGALSIEGYLNNPGAFDFVVKTKDLNSQIVVYKQFILDIVEQEQNYRCAPGYYWDNYLRYCVQASGRTCGSGTWYDSDSNACRPYQTNQSCRLGSHWDFWASRCVYTTAKRCPMNYEWDSYYNRCVRLPYTCSYNERYDYSARSCFPIYPSRVCSSGSTWDSYRARCVVTSRFCSSGSYWNGKRCENHRRVCRSDRYYDPARGRCLSRTTVRTCSPGSRWNYSSSRCIRRSTHVNRSCRMGTRWSTRLKRCVSHDRTRADRYPRRRDMPAPPTTRPDRPRRPHQPAPPTTRPDRPRRPHQPAPPTTRPDRPRRPHQPAPPTTRPDRPRRPHQSAPPTTRPDRPRRPHQSAPPRARPDRPSRGNNDGGGRGREGRRRNRG